MTTLIMTADMIGLHSVAEWFKRLNASIAYRAQAKRTMVLLSSLSDHELKDIGISRGEIYSLAWEKK